MIKSVFGWLDANIEKVFILVAYGAMGSIIFVEVIRRFFFNVQAPWSTTIPIAMFLWLTWMGTFSPAFYRGARAPALRRAVFLSAVGRAGLVRLWRDRHLFFD